MASQSPEAGSCAASATEHARAGVAWENAKCNIHVVAFTLQVEQSCKLPTA